MSTLIREFWLKNPDYWFAVGDKQKEVDRAIYYLFHNYDFTKEDDLGKVIYLDQFIRHFSRVETVEESFIYKCREKAAEVVDTVDLRLVCENELVWYLMPWKHLDYLHRCFIGMEKWLCGRQINAFPLLNRFFMDTYKKAYNEESVAKGVRASDGSAHYDRSVCGSCPDAYLLDDWSSLNLVKEAGPLLEPLMLIKGPVTVSLSGGVDSMLLIALLVKMGIDVCAAHIVYGNRVESCDECNFIKTYCSRLGVPLYVYKIEWLRRDSVDRAFYESMTRDIRFSVYKAIGRPVILGHIKEDVIENIWTNLAKGNHLDNLAKIGSSGVENEVVVLRPWLSVKKSLIYRVADLMSVPYLKNTTPSWSNRGKFRERFHVALLEQYGESVDDKIVEVGERLLKQAQLIDKLLYGAIRDSWDPVKRTIDVSSALLCDLDADGWLNIFTDLAHTRLKIKKPSYAACCDFKSRISRGAKHGLKVALSKEFVCCFSVSESKTLLNV